MQKGFLYLSSALAMLCLATQAQAQTCQGPVTRITGDKGYTRFLAFPSNAIVDATGATWRLSQHPQGRNLWPLGISGKTRACLRHGSVIGDTPLGITWQQRYSNGNAAGIVIGPHNGSPTRDTVVEEARFHNTGDGLRNGPKAEGTVLRGNWVTASYDDCVENDGKNSIVVEDNLLDGCFDGFSARNPDSKAEANDVMTLRRNLVRLAGVPGWPSKEKHLAPAHSTVFKWQSGSMKIRLVDNVFHLSQPARTKFGSIVDPFSLPDPGWGRYVLESKGNVIVWTGSGRYPFPVPPGFTLTTDRGVWDRAKSSWLSRHDGVARVS